MSSATLSGRDRHASSELRDVVPLAEATRTWFAISLQTFGGPAGQIAVMQHKLVEQKRWLSQQRFLHALNYCMLLPGPEAQQLAIYTGWLLNGTPGRADRRLAVRAAGIPRAARVVGDLHRLRRHDPGHLDLRRSGAGGDRGRDPGRAPGGQTLADPSVPDRARRGGLRRDQLLRGALPGRGARRRPAGLARQSTDRRSAAHCRARRAIRRARRRSSATTPCTTTFRPPAGSFSCSGSV